MDSVPKDIEHNFVFYRLLDAVLNEIEKVPAIVYDSPTILKETNLTGETVLHWLAVENHIAGIKLLRSLGASIPDYAVVEAVELGHTETVILLLELGADPKGFDLDRSLNNEIFGLSQKTKQLMRSYFSQYDYYEA